MTTANLLCPVDRIKTMDHTAAADVTAGEVMVVNGMVCLAYATAAAGDDVQLVYAADSVGMPITAETVAPGDAIYWDAGAERATKVTSGNTRCGRALSPASVADTDVRIELYNA